MVNYHIFIFITIFYIFRKCSKFYFSFRGGSGRQGGHSKQEAGTNSGALDSSPLLESNITDDEGETPKENLLLTVAAPAETINTGVVAADIPREKLPTGAYKMSYFFSSTSLYLETELVPPLMAEEEDNPKENLPTPLYSGGANNAAPKEKSPSSFLLFLLLVSVGTGKASGGASNTISILIMLPDLAFVTL